MSKIYRPLISPGINKNTTSQEHVQTSLDLDENFSQVISTTKYRLRQKQRELELQPFWKSFSTIMAMTSSIMLALIIFLGTLLSFSQLPPEVPYYYNANINTWELADKSILLLLPLIYLFVVSIIMRLIYQVFIPDNRLAMVANWIVISLNILTLFGAAQLANLII